MIATVPTFENFEQGQNSKHESPKDYVASYKTHGGQNIKVKLSNWGEVTEDKRTYDEIRLFLCNSYRIFVGFVS